VNAEEIHDKCKRRAEEDAGDNGDKVRQLKGRV